LRKRNNNNMTDDGPTTTIVIFSKEEEEETDWQCRQPNQSRQVLWRSSFFLEWFSERRQTHTHRPSRNRWNNKNEAAPLYDRTGIHTHTHSSHVQQTTIFI
jgi:hypothetical protein